MTSQWILIFLVVLFQCQCQYKFYYWSILFLLCTGAFANTAHINYSDTSTYNKIKGELESYGYTVTGTSGGSVSLSDFTGKDLHINVAGNNNCGNNCKTAYETYIGAGGNVIIAGDGTHNSNRTSSIEALIESKLSVGAITLFTNNANYLAHAHGSQYSDTSNYWVTRNVFRMTSGGTPLADNSGGSLSTWRNWAVYSYGNNGCKLIVTFDQAQFNHTGNNNSSTWSTRFYNFLTTTLSHESITSATINITPTTSQSSIITTDKATIGVNNNSGEYTNNGKKRFRLTSKPKYPTRTFTTSSIYKTNFALPSSSTYAIQDEFTKENIIDFDPTFTKISCDSDGSFFDLYLTNFEPERYYRILISSSLDGSDVIVDNDNVFKVIKHGWN